MDIELKPRPLRVTRRGIIALTLVSLLMGAAIALLTVVLTLPNCPTEDSCRGDYQSHWYGNVWTGKEQVP